MKSIQGLILALLLGGAAVVFNWIYLQKKAAEFEMVSFLGIRNGVKVRLGETLLESHFQQVPVPKRYADNLREHVFLYDDNRTVAGIKATREYASGDLVHLEDYKTPAQAIKLKDDERLIWIAVESRAFVPTLVNPGDEVTFVFPSAVGRPGGGAAGNTAESIGPFKIGALGSRLGDVNVSQGYSNSRSEERQIGIIVRVESGNLEANALRLLELTAGASRSMAVALHPRKEAE